MTCRGFWAHSQTPAHPWEPAPAVVSWRCASRTRPPTRSDRGPPSPLARGTPPSPLRRARRSLGSFFERKPEGLEGPTHGRTRNRHAALLLEELAMLFQGEVGVQANLGGQPLLQRRPFGRCGTGDRLGLHPSGLAAQPQVALDGRDRDAEGLCDLPAG